MESLPKPGLWKSKPQELSRFGAEVAFFANRRGIMLYVGTYSLELAALRKRLKEEGKSQAAVSELRGSED